VDEDEPEVLYTACIHAREVATPEVLLYFMDHLTDNYASDQSIQDLVDNREIWLVLVCNPDGYYYNELIAPWGGGMWRKNRRNNGDGTYGVDLNRNFGYMWGYDDIGSNPYPWGSGYRGTGPFSEPETQSLRDFEISHNFVLSNYYHACSNVLLYPWSYVRGPTPDEDIYRAIGDNIYALSGFQHGHELMYDVNGGAYDWEYGEQTLKPKILGVTIEVGSCGYGFWPPLEQCEVIKQENLEPLLYLTRLASNPYVYRPPRPPQIVGLPALADSTGYVVNWVHYDTANPAVQYELVELQQRQVTACSGEALDLWETDLFTVSSARAYSSPSALFSGSGDKYTAYLQTAFPYTVRAGDRLTFQTYFSMDFYYDFGYVQVSTDNETFTSISGNITTDYNPYGKNRGNGISGFSGGWIQASFSLADYVGQTIWIRFLYETDVAVSGEGWYIDDVHPCVAIDSVTVIASDLTQLSYEFTDRPMGRYWYQVRAADAEGQWGRWSPIGQTDVLGSGIVGDIDLDGLSSTVADLTAFSLYFLNGQSVFDVYPGLQVGATDANCDAVPLTVQDLNSLAEVVAGATVPCYEGGSSGPGGAVRSRPSGEAAAVPGSVPPFAPYYQVELQTSLFPDGDSIWVDIVLASTAGYLLSFQFHLEYDATVLSFEEARTGDVLSGWQFFDNHVTVSGDVADLKVLAVAQYLGSQVLEGDIDPRPTPATLVRLKYNLVSPDEPPATDIRFVWSDCGDNALVSGSLPGDVLTMDGLILSRQVLDPDGLDITGLDPRYGGADRTCFYELFGTPPVAAVDFISGRVADEPSGCCVGQVGDVNAEGGDEPTISDVSALIDHLFISGVALICLEEADVNQSGGAEPTPADITISDISMLIDHLFISGTPLPACL